MFRSIDQKQPSHWEYYSGTENSLNLIVDDPKNLEELRSVLAAQRPNELRVILKDDEGTILRSIFPERFDRIIEIPVAPTPCEEITRIIYNRINSIVKTQAQLEGETDKHIELDQVFDLLVRDEIEPYMEKLNAVNKDDPCFKTFQLLRWLKNDDVPGFDFGEYELNPGLRGLLQPAIDALLDVRSNGARYYLKVRTVGYTDPVPVTRETISLRKDKTGIDDWSRINHAFEIGISGCSNDKLDNKYPVYVEFSSVSGGQTMEKISNNCELGAVRAYVVTVYLMNKLNQDNVEYSYATGGIYPGSNDSKSEDPRKRKVSIEFTIKAGRVGK